MDRHSMDLDQSENSKGYKYLFSTALKKLKRVVQPIFFSGEGNFYPPLRSSFLSF